MKKIIIAALLMLSLSANAQSYKLEGTNFKVEQTSRSTTSTKTKFTWEVKGVKYPIYMSKSGACYILRVSKKTQKEYKSYLPKEVSAQVAKSYGIEYKPKK